MKGFVYLTITTVFLIGLLPGCKKEPQSGTIYGDGDKLTNLSEAIPIKDEWPWDAVRARIISDALDKQELKHELKIYNNEIIIGASR